MDKKNKMFIMGLNVILISMAIIMLVATTHSVHQVSLNSDYPKIVVYETQKLNSKSADISVGSNNAHLQEVKRTVNDDNTISITLVFREEE